MLSASEERGNANIKRFGDFGQNFYGRVFICAGFNFDNRVMGNISYLVNCINWLRDQDSNLDKQSQSLLSYH